MASESSTCAFSDISEKVDSDSSKNGKDSTIIESMVTVIIERKKVKVSTKFIIPHTQHVFLAMKTSEAFLQKTQDLSGKKDFQVTMASKGLIFSRVGNELEDFVDSLKYLHNRIPVKFFLKRRDYGAKLVIDATDEISEKTFFNILVKIRSVEEIEVFKLLLEGMRTSIEKKCQCNDSSDTDNSV